MSYVVTRRGGELRSESFPNPAQKHPCHGVAWLTFDNSGRARCLRFRAPRPASPVAQTAKVASPAVGSNMKSADSTPSRRPWSEIEGRGPLVPWLVGVSVLYVL